MNEPEITLYGAHWCPDCRRSKQFLGDHQIPYTWVDIEQDQEAEQTVIDKNDGKRIIPTIIFGDGSILVEPTNAELATKLGLQTRAERSHYDLIVIGGGPAGLTTAFYAAREGIDTLVIERAAFGGQAAVTEKLENLPGFPESISGRDFGARLRQQAEQFGATLLEAQDIVSLHSHDNYHCVTTATGDEYSALALVIASGSRYRRMDVPGESDYIGAGIHFCATCDGPFYKGGHVAVVGGGNSAAEESMHLAKFAERITMLVRGDELRASPVIVEKLHELPQVEIQWNTEVQAFDGDKSKLEQLHIVSRKTGEEHDLAIDAAFIFIGLDPNTGFLAESPMRLNDDGFIITGHDLVHDGDRPPGFETREPAALETSIPGIFAAGDVRVGSTKQVASAAGEGATAALLVRDYLRSR